MTDTTQAKANGRSEDVSLGELVAAASRDLSSLVHKEIELAKAELEVDAKKAGIGAGALGGGGVFALFGVLFGSVAVALGLHALGLALGWSFLIVGVAYFLVAGVLALVGVRSVKQIGPPQRTIDTTKASIAWAKHPTRDPAQD